MAEAAQTVAEDLGHALEETVGELLAAVGRAWRSDPRELPVIAARAAGHVVADWVAADRHATGRILVAVGRLVSLVGTPPTVIHRPNPCRIGGDGHNHPE